MPRHGGVCWLLEKAGHPSLLRWFKILPRDMLRVLKRELDGGRESGCGVGERTLTRLRVEKCVEIACCKTGLQVSAFYRLSAPYLAHHLRHNLAGLEASVLPLTL